MRASHRSTTRAARLARAVLPLLVATPIWLVPTAATAASVSFTIASPHHGEIDYKAAAKISGKATSGGSPAASTQVELDANTFPFHGFKKVATTTTSSTGAYNFAPKPTLDTKYRVALVSDPTDHSAALPIYVDTQPLGAHSSWTSTTITATFKLRYQPGVNPKNGPIWWYLELNGAPRLKLTATTHLGAPVSPGVWRETHVFHVKAGWSTFRWRTLIRDLPKQGMGRPVCEGPEAWDLGKLSCNPPKSLPPTGT